MAWAGDSLGCQLYYFLSSWWISNIQNNLNIWEKMILTTCSPPGCSGLPTTSSPSSSPSSMSSAPLDLYQGRSYHCVSTEQKSSPSNSFNFYHPHHYKLKHQNHWLDAFTQIKSSFRLSECRTLLLLLTVASLLPALPELGVKPNLIFDWSGKDN